VDISYFHSPLFDLAKMVVTAIAAIIVSVHRYASYIDKKLHAISGGKVSTIEDLVATVTKEQRLREKTTIAVYGDEELWSELRRGRFFGSLIADHAEPGKPGAPGAQVAVVQIIDDQEAERIIAGRTEPYILLYKQGPPYKGRRPPRAYITFANSEVTLEARLLELLRFMDVRQREPASEHSS